MKELGLYQYISGWRQLSVRRCQQPCISQQTRIFFIHVFYTPLKNDAIHLHSEIFKGILIASNSTQTIIQKHIYLVTDFIGWNFQRSYLNCFVPQKRQIYTRIIYLYHFIS